MTGIKEEVLAKVWTHQLWSHTPGTLKLNRRSQKLIKRATGSNS